MNEPNVIRINLDEASRTELNRLPRIHEGDSGIKLQLYTTEGFYADGDVVADFDTKTVSYRKTVDFYGQIEVPDELLADECCGDIHIHLTIENYDDLDFVCYDFVMPVVRIIHYDRFEPTPPVPPVDPWPVGYDLLEYVQSDGNCYIDSGISLREWDQNLRVYIDCIVMDWSGTQGIGDSESNYTYGMWLPHCNAGPTVLLRCSEGYSTWGTYPVQGAGQRMQYQLATDSGYNSFGYTISSSSFAEAADGAGYPNAQGNFYLFAANNWKTDTPYGFMRERIYDVQFNDRTTWRDFAQLRPVRRKRDGAVGFYEIYSNRFILPQGNGVLYAGPVRLDDVTLPANYHKCWYVQSNWANRTVTNQMPLLNTGIPVEDIKNLRYELEFQFGDYGGFGSPICVARDGGNVHYGFEVNDPSYWDSETNVTFYCGFGSYDTSTHNATSVTGVDVSKLIRFTMDGHNNYFKIDNKLITADSFYGALQATAPSELGSTLGSYTPGVNYPACFPVFGYIQGPVFSPSNPGQNGELTIDLKVYRLRIYDYRQNAYAVDLIPCYRGNQSEDGQAGFFDLITGNFIYDYINTQLDNPMSYLSVSGFWDY